MQGKVRFNDWKLPVLAAAVALLTLLALAACGSDDATPVPPTAASAPIQEAEATQPPEPSLTAAPVATAEPAPTAMPMAEPIATAMPAPTEEPTVEVQTTPPATEAAAAIAAPEPTATTEPTATPEPTVTAAPEPTVTPEPTATPAPPCEGTRGGAVGNCAPEFAGTQEWINSEPLSMENLRGKVVLIDFWTYSCINCLRTLPFMREWHDRYADEGLVIVGVHTPEFEFEKLYDNVVQATKDESVAWPVVQDNDFTVWRSYSNRFWPAKYLVDQNGVIQYRHFGEGKYAETEEQIRSLLEDMGAESQAFTEPLPSDQQRDAAYAQTDDREETPELFAGWQFTAIQGRGGIGQVQTYAEAAQVSLDTEGNPSVVAEFAMPGSVMSDHIYFQGPWAIGPESARHAQETTDITDFVLLVYSARSVNAVLISESGDPYKVLITLNGEHLTEENKGEDITIEEDGKSYLTVTGPKAYKIIEHPNWQKDQVLRMGSLSDNFGLFSFTFGSYEDGF